MKLEAVLIFLPCLIFDLSSTFTASKTKETVPCSDGHLCSQISNQTVKIENDPCDISSDCNHYPGDSYYCYNKQCYCSYIYVYAPEVSDTVCVTSRSYGEFCYYDVQCNYYYSSTECYNNQCECTYGLVYDYGRMYCITEEFWTSWKEWLLGFGCLALLIAIAGVIGFIIVKYKDQRAKKKREQMAIHMPTIISA